MRTQSSRNIVSKSPEKQVLVLLIIVVHFLHMLPYNYYSTPFHHVRLSPTMTGMTKAVRDIIDDYLSEVEKKMAQFLKTHDGSPSGQSEVQLKTISEKYSNHVLLLYGVSGSGKTTAIKHLLQKNWGFYLMPGNLDLNSQFNLYRRDEYSNDSRFLWSLIENIYDILPEMATHQPSIAVWSARLLLSRHLIFDVFLRVTAEKPGFQTPAKWFQFQTRYSAIFDPFESLFKLLLLVSSQGEGMRFEMPDLDELLDDHRKPKQPFYWCLDEAQCYLDTRISTHISGSSRVDNLLRQTLQVPLKWSKFENAEARFVVSGTSLKLQETIATIEKIEQVQRGKSENIPIKCHRVTDLPLLTSDEQFRKLIDKHGLLEKIRLWASAKPKVDLDREIKSWALRGNQDKLLQEIKSQRSLKRHQEKLVGMVQDTVMRCGIPLRGRYLWSALYVDRLKIFFSPDSSSNEVVVDVGAIRQAARETIEEGKIYLKQRLRNFVTENMKKS